MSSVGWPPRIVNRSVKYMEFIFEILFQFLLEFILEIGAEILMELGLHSVAQVFHGRRLATPFSLSSGTRC